nr:reverse transcriptase domain-containing protein [Tanacetum cinerariifolium]
PDLSFQHKDLLRACPHHGFTELHQPDIFYCPKPGRSRFFNAAAGGNLLERRTQDVLKIIENKSKASLSNQTNEIKNMMASLFQMNSTSTSGSGSLPSNTVSNPKGKLKAITIQSVCVLDGPTVPTPPLFINPEEDERVEDTLTGPDLVEYTVKVPPPPVQKYKPPF